MASYTAPAPKSFPTVEQGTYIGVVETIGVEDHTVEPDKFGKKGHYTFVFRWHLEGVETEDGDVVTLPQYVKLETSDRPYAKGVRAGRLPWLTEITRAFGESDLQPGDDVDPDRWLGKRAKLSVLQQVQSDGTVKNAINAVNRLDPRRPGVQTAAKVVAKSAPRPADDDSSNDVAF